MSAWTTRAAAIVLFLVAGDAVAQTSTRMAYTVNTLSDSVSLLRVSPDSGAFMSAGTLNIASPKAIAADVSGRFVYIASEAANRISPFSINATGGLVALPTVTTTAPVSIVPEATGRFLYASNATTGVISTFSIGANGSLTASGSQDAGDRGGTLAAHPSGRFLFSLDPTAARVVSLAINATSGALQLISAPPTGGTSPTTMVPEPRGRFLYVLHDLEDLLTVFRVNAGTGVLTLIQSLNVKNPAAAIVERTGRFLYVASPENDAILGYAIDQSTGLLTFVDTEILTQASPRAVAIDPTNRFLFAMSPSGGWVTRLAFNPATGVISEGPNVSIGQRVEGMAVVHPHERFLYTHGEVVLNTNATLEGFRVGASDGALTAADSVQLAGSAYEEAFHPSGRFLYALNINARAIDVFGITLATGELTLLQTMTMTSVGGASGLAIDPTGRFLFMACICNTVANARVRTFRISSTTGLLTDGGESGGTGNLFANTAAVDATGRFLYIGESGSDEFFTFTINQSTGSVTAGQVITISGEVVSRFMIDPLRRFLFVTTFQNRVHAFRVDATTGTLTAVNFVTLGGGSKGGAIDRTGRFVYAITAPGGGGSVHVLTVDPATGALAAAGFPPTSLGANVAGESVSLDPTGRFLHVGHGVPNGVKGIRTFAINPATGAITETGNTTLTFAPRTITSSGPVR